MKQILAAMTLFLVTAQLDHGPIVIQAAIPVLQTDTENSLAQRVLQQEHRIYPQAVRWFLQDQIHITDNHVAISGSHTSEVALYSPECTT